MALMNAVVDRLLTGVSQAYKPSNYISELILPIIKHDQYSGLLGKYGKEHLRIVNALAGGEGKYGRVKPMLTSTDRFQIEGHGLETALTKQDMANYSTPFNARRDKTMFLTTMLWLEKEKLLADTIFDPAIITQNTPLTGTAKWSDVDNSDPVSDSDAAHAVIEAQTGMQANKLVINKSVLRKLKRNVAILDKLGYKNNRAGKLSNQEIAEALDVEEIIIASAKYNSAAKGQADIFSDVWTDNAAFLYAPNNPDEMQQSLGYLVQKDGSSSRKVYRNPIDNPPGAESILVEDEYDFFMSDLTAEYLYIDCL